MVVVLFGNTDGYETEYDLVREAVRRRGGETVTVPVEEWYDGGPASIGTDAGVVFGEELDPSAVTGVFTMDDAFERVDPSRYGLCGDDERVAHRQLDEWRGLFRSALSILADRGVRVTATPAESHWDRLRPWELTAYDRAGIPVPETTFTNDPERVESFVETHTPTVATVVNGGQPEKLRPDDLTEERLAKLAAAPVKLQSFAPGTDARAYVLDGDFLGMVRYDYEGGFSFKSLGVDQTELGSERYEPSPELRETVLRAADLTPGPFCAVDVRVTDDGSFTVIEGNVCGRFGFHETAGTVDVSGPLADYLLGA